MYTLDLSFGSAQERERLNHTGITQRNILSHLNDLTDLRSSMLSDLLGLREKSRGFVLKAKAKFNVSFVARRRNQ
jgi:hypothetical protein